SKEDRAELCVSVFEGKVEMPGGRAAQVRDLTRHPDVRKLLFQPVPDLLAQLGDSVDFALALEFEESLTHVGGRPLSFVLGPWSLVPYPSSFARLDTTVVATARFVCRGLFRKARKYPRLTERRITRDKGQGTKDRPIVESEARPARIPA